MIALSFFIYALILTLIWVRNVLASIGIEMFYQALGLYDIAQKLYNYETGMRLQPRLSDC